MSRLKVSLRGALINELHLVPEKEYIGGRKEGSDIRLQAEKGISREHFRLKNIDGHWHLQSISRFGEVYSLGQRVEDVSLEHNQAFQVPPYEFQYLEIPEEIDINFPDEEFVKADENENTAVGVVAQVPYVKVVNSSGDILEMLRLEVGDTWVAGRDPSCQIVIADQRVSRRQFELRKINGIFTIIDLASVNGTFVNGSPISSTDPQPLKSGDSITVLDNHMFFELHDPNFKFKVEKLEVPPISMGPSEVTETEHTEFTSAGTNYRGNFNPGSVIDEAPISQVPVYDPSLVNDQLRGSGGPFTGMPSDADPNEFYQFNPTADGANNPSAWQRFKNNKPLLIAAVLAFLAVAYYISDQMNTDSNQQIAGNDPFSNLSINQQKEVKENYAMGEQMMAQEKYDLAADKFKKINDLLKQGYKDSLVLAKKAEELYLAKLQIQEDERSAKEREQQAQMIADTAKKCEKLLLPKVEMTDIDQCLQPIAALDLNNADYIRIKAQAEKLINDRKLQEDQQKNYAVNVKALRSLYDKAEKTRKDGYAFRAIKQYKEVVASIFPDPDGLKSKSKRMVKFIEGVIHKKTSESVTQAESLFQQGKYREAIQLLKEARVYDPENETIKDKMEQMRLDLRRQMMSLYQESVIDESYGVIDSSNSRQGAKDKWKKIVETDTEDGEYYKKAVIKLRKYGVL